jgi:PAS domain S-box-containing protein
MTERELPLNYLCDPRLAPHALAARPAWVWAADGSRPIWANGAALACMGAATLAELRARQLSSTVAEQISRIGRTLPRHKATRLERLRGLGGGIGRLLACQCSRIEIESTAAILIVSAEAVGATLSLNERVTRLLADHAEPLAAFTLDGYRVYETSAGSQALSSRDNIEALGAHTLVAKAKADGHAVGASAVGQIEIQQIGLASDALLLVRFEAGTTNGGGEAARVAALDDGPAIEAASAQTRREPTAPLAKPDSVGASKKNPLRFVWQIDEADRFRIDTRDFADAMGPRTASVLGHPWREIAALLELDRDERLTNALASRDTWSGIIISWPVDGLDERVNVELSGLPVYDRDRTFRGYRGFGVCRDVARLAAAAHVRGQSGESESPTTTGPGAAKPKPAMKSMPSIVSVLPASSGPNPHRPAPDSGTSPSPSTIAASPEHAVGPTASKVVSFRPSNASGGDKQPALSQGERTAFLEIGKTLAANAREAGTQVGSTGPLQPPSSDQMLPTSTGAGRTHQGGPAENRTEANADELASKADERGRSVASASQSAENEIRELRSILDTATDGVVTIDRSGYILTVNRSAEALFGYEAQELVGLPFVDLFALESHATVFDYLDSLTRTGIAGLLNDGREVIGRVRQGGLIPLFMTIGLVSDEEGKACAVLRDITQWKRAEEELLNAKRQAERASSAKSEFLAKISHEIRTPLNAIIGFSEIMMEERFGPVGNERYREYLKDIHTSGEHLISLINDLLDLSKIEAGKFDLSFTSVDLNDLIRQCVALMQPQANRERIIIRTSLSEALPPVMVDTRSARQILLNLLSNSIKFTGAGGQVIVSTAVTDRGEAVLRVRDTGVGMSEKDIEAALEPFRQLATSGRAGSGGTGLGLPLTKALAEANRATFVIRSTVNAGTLVEITFPASRVLAE